MNYILLIISIVFATSRNLLTKIGKNEFSLANAHKLNIVSAVISVFIFLISGYGNLSSFSASILVYGVLYAVFTMLGQICIVKAVASGSTSVSSLFTYCGFIIPTVFGTLWYNEEISFLRILGILILLFSLFLSVDTKSESSFSFKWLFFAVSSMLCSGIIGIIQKVFGNSPEAENQDMLLICAFSIMAVMSFVMYMADKAKGNVPKDFSAKKFLVIAPIIGVTIGLCNKINLFLSGALPSAVMFPAVNGGSIILTGIASVAILRENMSIKQKLSLIIGFIGILIIGMF